ncbi:MAG: NAD-dependent deacylase [Verrucomicrobia bacterium]|jgi:NAD-dependent deacetylase|nr:NAD-dependent deacylase [Verrucomicrobiota bacterium]
MSAAKRSYQQCVILTGAGISAESGLKTFRGADGLWEGHRPEEVASIEAWERDPETVLRFYNERRRQVRAARPNAAHSALAQLEDHFPVTIVTQNVDDLHERAGSRKVLHLHGEILWARSEKDPDHRVYLENRDISPGDRCPRGGQLRPDIVWFGEPVPAMMEAAEIVARADLFAVVGSSLQVYPAASLLDLVPEHCDRFAIDPALPASARSLGFESIPLPASEGVPVWVERMLAK